VRYSSNVSGDFVSGCLLLYSRDVGGVLKQSYFILCLDGTNLNLSHQGANLALGFRRRPLGSPPV
jgi:hypothetical protein